MLMLSSSATFLAAKLTEAYSGQQRTTFYFAGLTALATPNRVLRWLQIPFDPNAPTPLTFREKEAAFGSSPFLVNRSKRQWHAHTLIILY